jgi:hypothetical protein
VVFSDRHGRRDRSPGALHLPPASAVVWLARK